MQTHSIETYSRLWTILLLLTFILGGTLTCFLFPPFQTPDESGHFSAAIGHIHGSFAQKDAKPCLLSSDLYRYFDTGRIAFHYDEKMSSGKFANISQMQKQCIQTYVYPSISLSYPGVLLANAFVSDAENNPEQNYLLFYLSRFLDGLLVALMLARFCFLNLGVKPYRKGSLFLSSILLYPLFLQQSFSISTDIIVNALAISCITILIHWQKLKLFDIIMYMTLASGAAASKPYVIIIAITFPLIHIWGAAKKDSPALFFEKKSKLNIIFNPNVLLICGGLVALANVFVSVLKYAEWDHQGPGYDVVKQLFFILENPIFTAKIFFSAMWQSLQPDSRFGSLGWTDTPISHSSLCMYLSIVFGCFFIEFILSNFVREKDEDRPIKIKPLDSSNHNGFTILAAFLFVLITFYTVPFILYLKWFKVGWTGMHMQTRYLFFPIINLLGVLILTFNSLSIHQLFKKRLQVPAATYSAGTTLIATVLSLGCIVYLIRFSFILMQRYW